MNKIIIVSVIIVSLLIGMNFLIVNNAPINNSHLKLNRNIIKPDNAIPSKYNFTFLKNGDYNLSYIIVANQTVWAYNTLKPAVEGVNLKTGKYYNYSMPDGIINNEIQLYIPLNYIYFINKTSLEIDYINLSTMKLVELGAFYPAPPSTNTIIPNSYYLSNFGTTEIYNTYNSNTATYTICAGWSNLILIKSYKICGPSANTGTSFIKNYSNFYINICSFGSKPTNALMIAPSTSPTGYLSYGNMFYIGNNIFNENTTYFNSSSVAFSSGAKLYNLSNYYSTKNIIPVANNEIYGNYNLSNKVFNSKNFNIQLRNLLLECSMDYNKNYYMATNYIICVVKNNILNINSYNSTGALIKNNFILDNITLVNSNFSKIMNNSITNVSILPLNYSNYLWKSGYIYVHFTDTGAINYYNISINYSVIQVFKNPYNLNNFIFPISILFLFVFAGIFIYLKFNYGD